MASYPRLSTNSQPSFSPSPTDAGPPSSIHPDLLLSLTAGPSAPAWTGTVLHSQRDHGALPALFRAGSGLRGTAAHLLARKMRHASTAESDGSSSSSYKQNLPPSVPSELDGRSLGYTLGPAHGQLPQRPSVLPPLDSQHSPPAPPYLSISSGLPISRNTGDEYASSPAVTSSMYASPLHGQAPYEHSPSGRYHHIYSSSSHGHPLPISPVNSAPVYYDPPRAFEASGRSHSPANPTFMDSYYISSSSALPGPMVPIPSPSHLQPVHPIPAIPSRPMPSLPSPVPQPLAARSFYTQSQVLPVPATTSPQPIDSPTTPEFASVSDQATSVASSSKTGTRRDGDLPSEKPPPPRRQLIACNLCRSRKLKCDGERPCRHCSRRGVDCQYEDFVKKRGKGRKTKAKEHDAAMAASAASAAAAGLTALHTSGGATAAFLGTSPSFSSIPSASTPPQPDIRLSPPGYDPQPGSRISPVWTASSSSSIPSIKSEKKESSGDSAAAVSDGQRSNNNPSRYR